MFFIVRSFLIPFGAPRRVGAPVPALLRRPLPHLASPGMALLPQPRFLNRHPHRPGPALAPGRCHLSPGNGPGLALVSLPPGWLPVVPTCPVTKAIFLKHKSDQKALLSTASGAPHRPPHRGRSLLPSSHAALPHETASCSPAHSGSISHLASAPLCLSRLPSPLSGRHRIIL